MLVPMHQGRGGWYPASRRGEVHISVLRRRLLSPRPLFTRSSYALQYPAPSTKVTADGTLSSKEGGFVYSFLQRGVGVRLGLSACYRTSSAPLRLRRRRAQSISPAASLLYISAHHTPFLSANNAHRPNPNPQHHRRTTSALTSSQTQASPPSESPPPSPAAQSWPSSSRR